MSNAMMQSAVILAAVLASLIASMSMAAPAVRRSAKGRKRARNERRTNHLYEQFPTASGTDCDDCFYGATGLNDYATMPIAWR